MLSAAFLKIGKDIYADADGQIIVSNHEDSEFELPESVEDLDEICLDYTYYTCGQAKRIIDVFAEAGILTYRDEGILYSNLERGLDKIRSEEKNRD